MENHITPELRRTRPDITGFPVTIDGQVWLFANAPPALSPIWDEIFDQNQLDGGYAQPTLFVAAYRLLEANYLLTSDELIDLLNQLPVEDLVAPVENALFGPRRPHVTYGAWARASLLANGLDPDRLPPADRRLVLEQLVAMGRARNPAKVITSAMTSRKRAAFSGLVQGLLAQQELQKAKKAAAEEADRLRAEMAKAQAAPA